VIDNADALPCQASYGSLDLLRVPGFRQEELGLWSNIMHYLGYRCSVWRVQMIDRRLAAINIHYWDFYPLQTDIAPKSWVNDPDLDAFAAESCTLPGNSI
jgi:hypothetical protein